MDENYKSHILQYSQDKKDYIQRNRYAGEEQLLPFLDKVTNVLIGDEPFSDDVLEKLLDNKYYPVLDFFHSIVSFHSVRRKDEFTNPWTIDNPIIKKIVFSKGESPKERTYYINSLVVGFWYNEKLKSEDLVKFLKTNGFSLLNIVETVCSYTSNPFYKDFSRYNYQKKDSNAPQLTKFGEFLLPLLKPEKNFFGIKKENEYKKLIDKIVFGGNSENADRKYDWLMFLYEHYKEELAGKYEQFIVFINDRKEVRINYNCIDYLIEKDASAFESLVLNIINQYERLRNCLNFIYEFY